MRIEISQDAIDEIRRNPRTAAYLAKKLEPVKQAAEQSAPDAPMIGRGYRDSFKIVAGIDARHGAIARVINFDYKASWVEFGAHAGGKTLVLRYRTLGTALMKVRR